MFEVLHLFASEYFKSRSDVAHVLMRVRSGGARVVPHAVWRHGPAWVRETQARTGACSAGVLERKCNVGVQVPGTSSFFLQRDAKSFVMVFIR
jgi:hypothetical protein